MRFEPRLSAAVAMAALLAACARTPAPLSQAGFAQSVPHIGECRVGPDGGPAEPSTVTDRGIGGTGAPSRPAMLADRGIGGTGIVGVITGFASVCLAGQEVAVPPEMPVDKLRAGHVAVIDAADDTAGLRARHIELRFEVIGPVQRRDGDALLVAGQTVSVTARTLGIAPDIGDWVAVSGLRQPGGAIEATRIERSLPGPVLVHGIAERAPSGLRIGTLPIAPSPQAEAATGLPTTLAGRLVDGTLVPDTVAPDLLIADPGAFFGPSIGTVVVEGFAVIEGGRLHLGPVFSAPASGFERVGGHGVFRFERASGRLQAMPPSPRAAFTPIAIAPRFEPAPLPNRAMPGQGFGRSGPAGLGHDQTAPRSGDRPNAARPQRPVGESGPGLGGRMAR